MPRNRSRSPHSKRDRRGSRSRSRERRHRKKRSRSRSPRHRGSSPRHRSRSPHSPRRRQRSPSPSKHRERDSSSLEKGTQDMAVQQIDESKLEGLDDEQVDMMKLMGFAGFDTTKGKKVSGNDVSAVNLQRKRKYRQYMNRRGGFNRPLDFIA